MCVVGIQIVGASPEIIASKDVDQQEAGLGFRAQTQLLGSDMDLSVSGGIISTRSIAYPLLVIFKWYCKGIDSALYMIFFYMLTRYQIEDSFL